MPDASGSAQFEWEPPPNRRAAPVTWATTGVGTASLALINGLLQPEELVGLTWLYGVSSVLLLAAAALSWHRVGLVADSDA